MNRIIGRLTAACTTAALVAIASPAWAHVHVDSADATQGGFGLATFRVPNESESAATTKLSITLPTDAPFASVSGEAKPGWKISTTAEKLDKPVTSGDFEITEPTRTITWTATGPGIPPGQFDTFGLSGGPFPETDELVLPTTQTYDDGEVVAWDQEQTGDTEPERPAPVLAVAEADTDVQEASSSTESSSDPTALVVAIAAAVLAAAALLVSVRQNRTRA